MIKKNLINHFNRIKSDANRATLPLVGITVLLFQASYVQSAVLPPLRVSSVKINEEMMRCKGKYAVKGCPDLKISFVKTNDSWVTQTINNQLAQFLLQQSQEVVDQNPKKNTPSFWTAAQQKKIVLKFIKNYSEQSIKAVKDQSHPYSYDLEAKYLGAGPAQVARFGISSYAYTGGAHGVGSYSSVLLDRQNKKHLKLDDLTISPDKVAQINDLLRVCYDDYVIANNQDGDQAEQKSQAISDYKKTWPFVVPDNIDLDKQGLTFIYQPYEIAPYSNGMPKWTIPYSQLKGILKPQYLPAPKQSLLPSIAVKCDAHIQSK